MQTLRRDGGHREPWRVFRDIVEADGERRRVECVHGVDRQPRAWPQELP